MAADDTLISLITPKNLFSADKKNHTPEVQKETHSLKFTAWFQRYWVYLVFLVSLVFIVYFNSLDNGLVSDDRGLLLDEKNLTKFSYIFNDPLSFIWSLVHAPFYALFGINPTVLRSLNILMHMGNVGLVFGVLTLISNPLLAVLTASIFAVHPLGSEAVIWISGGPYSWYTFFFLLAFLLYILGRKTKKYYYFSLIVFVIGLLTSNRIMTLFPIFFVYEFVFGDLKKYWKRLLPYVGVSIIWGINYFLQIGLRQTSLQTEFYLERGLDNPLVQLPYAISNYLQMFFFPLELTFYHSDLTLSYFRLGAYWLGLVLFIGIWVWSFLKKRVVFFWLSFFIISLAITLTPFRIAWIVAERYVYLGLIGLIVPVALIFQRLIKDKKTKVLGIGVFSLLLIILSVRTMVRNMDWQSEKSLWLATVKTTPESPKAHNNIGVIYTQEASQLLERGNKDQAGMLFSQAEKELAKAIELKSNYGDAYHNLANLYRLTGHLDPAIELYGQALKINPNLYQSYTNLADVYFKQEKYEDSLQAMLSAQKIQPQDIDIYINLSKIYFKLGDVQKAKEALSLALKLNPQDPQALQMVQQLQ